MSLRFLASFFALNLAAVGALVPFIASHLEALGFGGGPIGLLLAILPLSRLVSASAWGWAADRYHIGGYLLRAGSVLATLGMGLLWIAETPLWIGIGLGCFAIGRTPLGPLIDTFTMQALVARGRPPTDYGQIRLWGSLGFLLAALAAGGLVQAGWSALALAFALQVSTTLQSFVFPTREGGRPAPIGPALRALAGQRGFWPLLCFGAAQVFTVNIYDTFFSVHVRALGLPALVTSAAVVVGVAVEIGVMAKGQRLLARLGVDNALLLAAVSLIPRWLITAWSSDPVVLVAAQALHGLGFALFWIAGVEALRQRSDGLGVAASAQSLWASATYGVGAILGALVAGRVRESLGTDAIFVVCAGVSVFATLLAYLGRRRGRAGVTHG